MERHDCDVGSLNSLTQCTKLFILIRDTQTEIIRKFITGKFQLNPQELVEHFMSGLPPTREVATGESLGLPQYQVRSSLSTGSWKLHTIHASCYKFSNSTVTSKCGCSRGNLLHRWLLACLIQKLTCLSYTI